MSQLRRIVLDVLKPHQPSGLEFSRTLADLAPGYHVKYKVEEIDEKTESVLITIEGNDVDFELVRESISEMGGSLHSVDEVEVENISQTDESI